MSTKHPARGCLACLVLLAAGIALVAAPTASANPSVATSTSFTVTPDPGVAGQQSTLHISVAGPPGSCGFVRVYDNGAQITGPFLDQNEQADATIGNFAAGTHPLSVHFEGCSQDGIDYQPSDSSIDQYVVNPVPTTTTVKASDNPAASDQTVTLTSTTNLAAGYITPQNGPYGGAVQFYDGSRLLGTGVIDYNAPEGEQAHIDTTLPRGTRNLKAVFLGAGDWATSTSRIYRETVQGIDTTITLSSTANPSVFGQRAVYATVTPARSTTALLAGRVDFYEGGVTIASAAVSSTGVAYLRPTALSVGSHTLTAKYAGNTTFNPSPTSASLSQDVQQASSRTTIRSSQNPSTSGANVTFTATVRAAAPATGYPPGSVTFRDGTTVLGTVPLSSTSTATLSTASLAVGTHSMTAAYSGSAGYAASTSSVLKQTVNP
jgi:hypothetical protein